MDNRTRKSGKIIDKRDEKIISLWDYWESKYFHGAVENKIKTI